MCFRGRTLEAVTTCVPCWNVDPSASVFSNFIFYRLTSLSWREDNYNLRRR